MSSNIRKYYQEYEEYLQNKKLCSNPNRISAKQANVKTNKYNKSCAKAESINIILPFGYGIDKSMSENNVNCEEEIKNIDKKFFNIKKKKIAFRKRNILVEKKLFYKKDGRPEKFKLFRENELGLNTFDDKVNILQSEEDYDSDDMIVTDGVKKAKEDLFEALEIFRKNKFKDIKNYQKYYK